VRDPERDRSNRTWRADLSGPSPSSAANSPAAAPTRPGTGLPITRIRSDVRFPGRDRLEGILFAAFPLGTKRAMAAALDMPDGRLRVMGLLSAIVGVAIVWLYDISSSAAERETDRNDRPRNGSRGGAVRGRAAVSERCAAAKRSGRSIQSQSHGMH
jgi:uncharacterized protein